MSKNALMVRTSTVDLVRLESMDAQFALFDKYKLARTMAETHRFIPGDDKDHPYKLVKRASPIKIFEDGEQLKAVSAVQMTQAERVGLSRGRGKYNDEGRLFEQDSASLKVGEVAAWSSI